MSVQREHQAHARRAHRPGQPQAADPPDRGGAGPGGQAGSSDRSASCCSTWTGSRRSTTPSGTRSATGCCSRGAPAHPQRAARATWWRGSAATSSRCCCPSVRDAARGPRGGRAAAGRAGRADPAGRDVVRHRGQRRHRALPGRRARDFELLLQHADVAMYLAKERRTGVELYVADRDRNSPARLALLGDLRRGHRPRRAGAALPAQGLPGRPAHGGHGGAGPLAAPGRGLMQPGRVHPARRAVLPDARAHRLRHRHGAGARPRSGGRPGIAVQVSVNVSARDLLDDGLADVIEPRAAPARPAARGAAAGDRPSGC